LDSTLLICLVNSLVNSLTPDIIGCNGPYFFLVLFGRGWSSISLGHCGL
jgi:hypothetical protein